MRLIKLFEQYVREESEMASMPVSNTVTPQTLLDNTSTEFNNVIGVKKLPRNFSLTSTNPVGLFPDETNFVIDALDFPIQQDRAPRQLVEWIQGKNQPRVLKAYIKDIPAIANSSGPLANRGALKDRFIHHTDGLWYPAVEDLRVKYNLDESFETLGSSVNSTELATVKKELLECYQYWISSINAMAIPVPSGDVSLLPSKSPVNEGTIVDITGKSELIQVLRNHLNSTENSNEWKAIEVAQAIYNDCAQFMNKTKLFLDKTKYGYDITKPAASEAPTEVISTATPEPTTPGPATVGPATPAPATGGPATALSPGKI